MLLSGLWQQHHTCQQHRCVALRGTPVLCRSTAEARKQRATSSRSSEKGLSDDERPYMTVQRDTKVCAACGQEKPIDKFCRHWLSIDGHEHNCLSCRMKRTHTASKLWRTKALFNPEYLEEGLSTTNEDGTLRYKTCTLCTKELPLSEFHLNRFRTQGLFSVCKRCHTGQNKARRKINFMRATEVSEADQEFAVAKCSDCQQMLPLTSFYKAPGNTHHRSVYCKVCATRRVRSMMARRPRGALPTHKCCSRCQKTLPADDFYSCSSSATGLHSQCKECYRQTERDRRMQKSKRASPLQKAQG